MRRTRRDRQCSENTAATRTAQKGRFKLTVSPAGLRQRGLVWDDLSRPLDENSDHVVYVGIRLSEINVAGSTGHRDLKAKDKPWEFNPIFGQLVGRNPAFHEGELCHAKPLLGDAEPSRCENMKRNLLHGSAAS